MKQQINVQEAKTRLSELLRLVEAGQEIIIARAGIPIASLQPITKKQRDFSQPLLSGISKIDASSTFNNDLDETEIEEWFAFNKEEFDV